MDFAARRRRLREAMAAAGVDLLAVAPGDNLRYLLGYSPHPDERPCFLLLSAAGEGLLLPALNAAEAEAHVAVPMAAYTDAEGPRAALAGLLRRLEADRARTVAVEEPMRADFALLLAEAVPGARLVLAGELIAALRRVKDPAEVELLQRSAQVADRALERALAALRPGLSEREVARLVADAFAAEGAEAVKFALVASGPNSAHPHHQSGTRVLQPGEPVLLDVGGSLEGYQSDITRMAFLGEPTDEYRRVHAVVEEAVQAALAVIRPGVPAREVDAAARGVIERAGYGPHFTHRVGHGIGLSGHEPPYLTGTNPEPLEVGMAFSVEPGIYLPGRFGVRLEEIVVLTERGPQVLSRLPRDVRVIA